jgi:hypothetical protein
MNFANLKKNSGKFDNLLKEVEKINNPSANYEKDENENYWKPTPDKTGNALAVIRFLPGPAVDGDDGLPWVRYFDHGFQNKTTGKWYIEKSLTTFDEKDPVSEYNSKLWNSTQDDNSPERKQARDQKRRLHYVANIYVVSDPQNNPTDLWKGAHFKLKMTRQNVNIGGRNVSFPNYDESTFLAQGPLLEDDDAMESIWKSEYSLAEIIDRKNFKTYEELKRRLDEVNGVGGASASRKSAPVVEEDEEEVPFPDSKPVARKAPAPVVEDEEEDEDLAMFRKLAED